MNGRSLVTYNYGDNAYKGQVQTLTYGNGQIVYYTYDALGRVVNIGYTNQPNRFTYVYDSDGELLAIEDSVMSQTTIYNDTGYQIRTLNGALIYSCSADEDGNTTESIGELEYQTTFNSDTNSTAIIGSDDATVMTASHAYDAFNRLENKLLTLGNTQVTRTYSYSTDRNGNTGNLVSSYSTSYVRGNSELTSMVFSYTYDGNGNITNVVRTESTDPLVPSPKPVVPEDEPVTMTLGDDRIVTSYAYDAAGQLIEVIDDESEKIYRYTYDNSGNIRSAKTYVYDDDGNEVLSENRTYNYTNGILTSYTNGTDTVQYVSDAMGNPIRIIGGNATKVLTWGEGRMLLGVKQNNSNYFQYSYDVDGLRTRATIINNGVTTTKQYVWGDNGLAGTIIDDDSGYTAVVPMYDSEGEAIGFAVQQMSNNMMPSAGDPQVYTYVKNLQGDVLRVLDSSGNVVVSYAYDPWGKPTVTGDEELAALNPCSYRGYDYDEETGFYYLQSRYYDPQIGRFINSDDTSYMGNASVILDYNIWGYCDNDPINYCDANGHSPLRWICASIGAIAGWYFGDYVAKLIGYKTQEQYWAIRAGVIIGGAVICWFAATRIVKIVVKYLTDNPNTIFKLVNKWSAKKFMTAMKFLGINPFTLTMDSTKFIAIARQFNTREITIGLNWAKQLYYRAKALGFKIVLDRPHGGFSWHIHLSGGNGRLRNLHIQITKAAWDYLWKLLN